MDGTAEPSAPVTGMTLRKVPGSDMVVPALTRGFAILDLVAKNPGLDFTSIHGRLGLPKSSTHNLLSTLSRLGLVRMRPDRGFVLGLKLTELGAFAASHRFVEAESLPLLRALAGELQLTCHLGVSEGAEAVYLSKIDCDQPIRVDSWVGKRFSLHSSALGKVLLAWLPDAELQQALAAINWVQNTPYTITSPAAMHAHLQLVRANGWATDDEENVPNIRCVAAPVFDRQHNVVAAISAVGTILQIDQARFELIAPRLVAVASEISHRAFTG
ncbi:MAG TPA: IclR family transcriptional regulator [Acidocella sp.]|jgi:DNA-binding IclR family transcriptional regulator|uniref:IclR family transcriptional regulator n=1 Tax=Acidocella sp. TaxID=50710 RepID=UPI002B5FCC92|nr:IclR family transcriptional regulator [Acidocella sp.]HVE21069.1 IclR family transcriptional regulator [Acidocella sp.]